MLRILLSAAQVCVLGATVAKCRRRARSQTLCGQLGWKRHPRHRHGDQPGREAVEVGPSRMDCRDRARRPIFITIENTKGDAG